MGTCSLKRKASNLKSIWLSFSTRTIEHLREMIPLPIGKFLLLLLLAWRNRDRGDGGGVGWGEFPDRSFLSVCTSADRTHMSHEKHPEHSRTSYILAPFKCLHLDHSFLGQVYQASLSMHCILYVPAKVSLLYFSQVGPEFIIASNDRYSSRLTSCYSQDSCLSIFQLVPISV